MQASAVLAETTGQSQEVSPLIVSAHPEYPPVMWQDGETIKGTATQLVRAIFTELDVEFVIKYAGPWKRVQQNARLDKIDIIAGIYHNTERAEYLLYSEPYMDDPTSIMAPEGKTFPFQDWRDLVGKRGVAPHGDSFGEDFDRVIKEHLQVSNAYTLGKCLQQLTSGKADYLVSGYYPALIHAKSLGYLTRLEVVKRDVVTSGMFMAFSKKSSYRHLLPKINTIIAHLRQNGTVEKWNKANLELYWSKEK